MKIAMAAPLIEAVPPPLYGGTERVVSTLTEELVRRGHPSPSSPAPTPHRRHPRPLRRAGLRLEDALGDAVAYTLIELDMVYERAAEFDIIHNHCDYLAFPFARRSATPTVTTMHGRLDLPEVRRLDARFPDQPLVSISDAQRAALPDATWLATVYNGIDVASYHFRPDPGDYLVFLGRISPEKRVDRAIEIARDTGMRLVIAAKVDPLDRDYYDHAIAPLIDEHAQIEFIGEVDERGKDEVLGGAYAYLFPIDWPEPFGLTMVEAMATGTPVIAYKAGSVPEVVVDGVTGFISETVHGMVEAVGRIPTIDRRACRAHVEEHFSAAAMANGYERVYQGLFDRGEPRHFTAL